MILRAHFIQIMGKRVMKISRKSLIKRMARIVASKLLQLQERNQSMTRIQTSLIVLRTRLLSLYLDVVEEIEEGKEAVVVDTAEIMIEEITVAVEEVEVETTTKMMIAIRIGQEKRPILEQETRVVRSIVISFRTQMIQIIMVNRRMSQKIKKVIAFSTNLAREEDNNMSTVEAVEEEATVEKEEEEVDMIEEVMTDLKPVEVEAVEAEWAKINETRRHSVKCLLKISSSVMKASLNTANLEMITSTTDKTLVAMAYTEKASIKAQSMSKMTMMITGSMTKRRRT